MKSEDCFMSKEELIKDLLVVDEMALLEDILKIASELISLTPKGEILFKINKDELSVKEKIILYMIGKQFATEAKLIDNDHVNLEELSTFLRVSKGSLASRIGELRNERKIKDVKRGEYELFPYDLKQYLLEIKKKLRKK